MSVVEVCDGVAYIEWEKLRRMKRDCLTTDLALKQCLGRYRRILVPEAMRPTWQLNTDNGSSPGASVGSSVVGVKYVRSLGSTAVVYGEADSSGRSVGNPRTLGPWELRGVQVGPIEESVVELLDRTQQRGIDETMVEPARVLLERTRMVAVRSAEMVKEAVFPFTGFMRKLRDRVPELARNSLAIASSIKIEIKIEDDSTPEQ